MQRSIYGSTAAPNQISVGPQGNIPILPGGALVCCVLAGLASILLFGRKRFLPSPLRPLWLRAAVFAAVFASMVSVIKMGEAQMKRPNNNQGANFLPVTDLVTTGPYQYSRNPMYCLMLVFPFAVGTLSDSINMMAALSLLPVYIHLYVIPAEEALLRKLFGRAYDDYCDKVPRWLIR